MKVKAPFPWFGGKSRVAHLVWERFGDVHNYVEPFFGSGAVLLNRPVVGAPRIETVNDKDAYLANFWRALQVVPGEVGRWCDWPVNEADLHARHKWLLAQSEFRARMESEPEYYDAKIAGWWVWGVCQWIGSGWCAEDFYSGNGWQQLPHLGNAGRGVHRPHQEAQQLPMMRPSSGCPQGIHHDLYQFFDVLRERMRNVRVGCGDWARILGESPTVKLGLTGVFLDPPYSGERGESLYGVDDLNVAHAVCEWAVAHGNDPMLRIALCGYAGEHVMPEDWDAVAWKANGGYGSQGNGRGRKNSRRERIWFSPSCLPRLNLGLFDKAGRSGERPDILRAESTWELEPPVLDG